ILNNGDCAEEFDVLGDEEPEPGTVMALGSGGRLRQSTDAYDKRVAGVIAGAGGLKPGIILGRNAKSGRRWPIAIAGKVYCRADARYSAIAVGDLLTTSGTPGHAMKAEDPAKA